MQKQLELGNIKFEEFTLKLLEFGSKLKKFAFLNSNHFAQLNNQFTYYDFDFLAALGSKKEILSFNDLHKVCDKRNHDWLFGFLTYDLKNEIENLSSNNVDELTFPVLHFFSPDVIFLSQNSTISIIYDDSNYGEKEIYQYIEKIKNTDVPKQSSENTQINLKHRFSKSDYIDTVNKIKKHIQRGDIYEANFCQEFYSLSKIDPLKTYLKLDEVSPTPFSCFYKIDDKYLISASPERFLKKDGNKIISQPIKGTIKKGKSKLEDNKLKKQLYNDPKERAENVMIVDLVRNDLSRTAIKGSVKVEELFGIYSFKQVHQMISTVVSEVKSQTNIIEIIKNAFPMGSMTGAPKIRTMQLIEDYERTKRGLYSGSVGYITPENNFDFNVVIRSILYNQTKNYVSYTVGGAITSLSDPDKEYEECMIKAEAMQKALS